ncbi:MAG: amino acid ABC transporter permease [Pelagimonas sp.]|uniref:amino acid ABC transporter permease n=1 Tax=Pelagimonas sp. TaxID=2073170 RepID=UPI003D6A2334
MTDFLQSIFGDFYGKMIFILLDATQYTIYLSLVAFIGGGLIGLVMTVLKILPNKGARIVATSYIWLFQSIPLLMLLFLIGLGVPSFFLIEVSPWMAAGISLTLFTSAYMAEVWRGALESVPTGQWEGSKALGMTFRQTLTDIIAPQALRIAIAPTVGFMVQVIKGTSMAYIIDFTDLMRWGKKIANSQVPGAEPFIVFPIVALIYFALCFPLSQWAKSLERKQALGKSR